MSAAKMSSQYISDRFLPDKAIDLIDEAGSRVRLRNIQVRPRASHVACIHMCGVRVEWLASCVA